jgi:hypothetical protein
MRRGRRRVPCEGALVVAPEKAMKYFLDQLKRITAECGSHPVFVLTPWLRFARVPCCDDAGHVTNFHEPDFLASLLSDLTKLKYQLRKAVTPAIVVDSLELRERSPGCRRQRRRQRTKPPVRPGPAPVPKGVRRRVLPREFPWEGRL